MSRSTMVSCPLSAASAEVEDLDLEEGVDDPELPVGWVELTLTRVVENPARNEMLAFRVEAALQAIVQGGDKRDPAKIREELTQAVLDGEVPGVELPPQHMLIEVTEQFSPEALTILETAIKQLQLPAFDQVFHPEQAE